MPTEEWANIFDEVWRRYRDFFYVENMHGYPWASLREQYRPLLEHVGHRSDLNYVIGEMIAELNVGHAYIVGGDYEVPDRPQVALLGCRFELDEDAGRYRISEIFEGQNEEETYRSPLTAVGVDVDEGDYVLSIDGVDLTADENPYRPAPLPGRPAGDARGQRRADDRRRPASLGRPDHQRGQPALPRLGHGEPPEGRRGDRRQGRLPPHPGHGRRGHPRVHQVLLSPDFASKG